MKTGLYITGLGQADINENATDYASRLANECNKNDDAYSYAIKIEKIAYTTAQKSNVIRIVKTDRITLASEIYYTFYEFDYGSFLSKSYTEKNLLYKNYLLLSIVVTKFPLLLWKSIRPTKQYQSQFQTLYVFSLFFLIALAILIMIPATLSLLLNEPLIEAIKSIPFLYKCIQMLGITKAGLIGFSEMFVPIITLILLLLPKANIFLTTLASEFVSVHLYLQYSEQKGLILGNLDQLYEYIVNHEDDPEIHLHAYSFGSIIALDYLYPYKSELAGNTLKRTKGLITIGAPFDFITTYYPKYYKDRGTTIDQKGLQWINVYSIVDVLASNFRNDGLAGEAVYGCTEKGTIPININYEAVNTDTFGFFNYLFLNNLKVHRKYWSETTDGKSCLEPIYSKMMSLQML